MSRRIIPRPEQAPAAPEANSPPLYDLANREIPKIYLPFLVSEKVSVFVNKSGVALDRNHLLSLAEDDFFHKTFATPVFDSKFGEVCRLNLAGSGVLSVMSNFFTGSYSYRAHTYLNDVYGRMSPNSKDIVFHDILSFEDIYSPFLFTETSVAIQSAIVQTIKLKEIVREDSR